MNVLFTYCMREGLANNRLQYSDIYPNDMNVFIHSSLDVLITSVFYGDFWEEAVIILSYYQSVF